MMMGGGGFGGINLGGNFARGGQATGQARMTLASSEEDFGKAFDPRVIRRLWTFVSPYKLRVALGVVLLLLYTATVILNPLIPGLAINQVTKHSNKGLIVICVLFCVNNVVMWLAQ